MTIITQIHSSKKNNFKTYAKNINSSDFIELLNHEELAPIIENNMPNHRENIYTPTRNYDGGQVLELRWGSVRWGSGLVFCTSVYDGGQVLYFALASVGGTYAT